MVFKTVCCFLVFYLDVKFFRGRYCGKVPPLFVYEGYPLANMSEVIGKFVICCERLLATLGQLPQRVLATFSRITYLSEGCQDPLISFNRLLNILWEVGRGIGEPVETFALGFPH
jgi:hypothetical protein